MAENNKTDKRILVRVPAGASVSADDLKSLLVEAGVDADLIETVEADGEDPDFGPDDDLVIVLESGLTGEDEVAERAVKAGVCSIVGVWAPGENHKDIHPAMRRYATAQVPWQAGDLANALDRDCDAPFLTPQGQDATRQIVKPHKC